VGERFECVSPGIIGLFEFVAEHEEAIEYDLISLGLRLRQIGQEDFTLRDLLTIIKQSPRESAIVRATQPDSHMWSHTDFILALLYDKQAEHNWMISKDGARGHKRPKPLPRPGLVDPNTEITQIRGKAVPIEEMERILGHEAPFKLRAVPASA